MSSETPPYSSWVGDWNNNLPLGLQGTGFIRMTMTAVHATATEFDVLVDTMWFAGFDWGLIPEGPEFVTVTGGPFTVGQVIETPTFPVHLGDPDLWANDSAEVGILWVASPPYTAGPDPDFAAEGPPTLVMTDQTFP